MGHAKNLTIIKLGGALLTNKSVPYTSNDAVIKEIAREIKECLASGLIEDLIIVHGVGSFGHPPVLEHKLHHGFKGTHQLIPLSQTQLIVNKFRFFLANELINVGIPVNLFHSSSIFTSEKMRISNFFLDSIKGFLSIGMVPLIGGDMLSDNKMGFCVGSGDQILTLLSKELDADQMIFATDVSGIHEADPKLNPNSPIINNLNIQDLEQVMTNMDNSKLKDASGAMKGKLQSLLVLKEQIKTGFEISIISMNSYGNLISLLKGDLKKFTKIAR
ncbi:isopentenyl phosphate kinase [Promethearchaeum syntrophicum]|uniref:Isopentenyl phosphate kinase n=1 Tax=Promethearchaeum syntrophicum TaxID=2594042 RepID=A0A5B9DEF3_9ARCH|nr:isopentenyl phosphate kinase [Candidatus Prometheoarchaeum syntrophicum]QEE17153.1 Isopentenyl phosphate kinase [Candidatus Prometheoarchaeum syntrophicum]